MQVCWVRGVSSPAPDHRRRGCSIGSSIADRGKGVHGIVGGHPSAGPPVRKNDHPPTASSFSLNQHTPQLAEDFKTSIEQVREKNKISFLILLILNKKGAYEVFDNGNPPLLHPVQEYANISILTGHRITVYVCGSLRAIRELHVLKSHDSRTFQDVSQSDRYWFLHKKKQSFAFHVSVCAKVMLGNISNFFSESNFHSIF